MEFIVKIPLEFYIKSHPDYFPKIHGQRLQLETAITKEFVENYLKEFESKKRFL